jgi:hypothetical protein
MSKVRETDYSVTQASSAEGRRRTKGDEIQRSYLVFLALDLHEASCRQKSKVRMPGMYKGRAARVSGED